jgi:hypothetical protein
LSGELLEGLRVGMGQFVEVEANPEGVEIRLERLPDAKQVSHHVQLGNRPVSGRIQVEVQLGAEIV